MIGFDFRKGVGVSDEEVEVTIDSRVFDQVEGLF